MNYGHLFGPAGRGGRARMRNKIKINVYFVCCNGIFYEVNKSIPERLISSHARIHTQDPSVFNSPWYYTFDKTLLPIRSIK